MTDWRSKNDQELTAADISAMRQAAMLWETVKPAQPARQPAGRGGPAVTVGQLRAAIEGVRDEAVLICEGRDQASWAMQFDVVEIMPIGASTEDPGVVLKVVRTR